MYMYMYTYIYIYIYIAKATSFEVTPSVVSLASIDCFSKVWKAIMRAKALPKKCAQVPHMSNCMASQTGSVTWGGYPPDFFMTHRKF